MRLASGRPHVAGTIFAPKSRIMLCTSGSLRMVSSAARWRASAASLLRRAGLSVTAPTSTAMLDARGRGRAAPLCSRSRLAGWLSDSRSTRSIHWSSSRATSCDCSASSRTSAAMASAATMLLTVACQKSPSSLGDQVAAGPAAAACRAAPGGAARAPARRRRRLRLSGAARPLARASGSPGRQSGARSASTG